VARSTAANEGEVHDEEEIHVARVGPTQLRVGPYGPNPAL